MAGSTDHETVLNARLAELLRRIGLDARAEYRQPGSVKQIDVDVNMGSHRVALEAEIDNPKGAWQDAAKRRKEAEAGQVVADRVIAVNYPAGLLASSFTAGTSVELAVLPSSNFFPTPVAALAGVIRRSQPIGKDPDSIAKELDDILTTATERLSTSQRDDLTAALDVDPTKANNKTVRAAAKRALLVVAAAAMFHARLDDGNLPALRPAIDARSGEPYEGDWPPGKMQQCVTSPDVVGALDEAWNMILAVDYRPIFEAGRRVLMAPAQNAAWAQSVKHVAGRALSVARDAASARHDLMGRIFHRLVDTARYDGSYYTSTAAAVLLAGLSISPDSLPSELGDYRLIDPACGTGTLLMAAAERIRDLRGVEHATEDATVLIEHVISGLDVNTTACHMAATTLGLLSPSTTFSRMNIRRMTLGVDSNGDTRVGSLELLTHKKGAPRLDLDLDWASGEHVDTGDMAEIAANSMDLVIMNPPYTRDSLRHDQFPTAVEKKLKAREKTLTAGRAGHGSSSGTMFMDLGEHLTGLDDGATLAFVAPLAMAGAPSARPARKLLAEWFHIEWVVASHDPTRPHFSENTAISEMLVVCRRDGRSISRRPPTKFVRLRKNPSAATEAAFLGAALETGELPAPFGSITSRPAEKMSDGYWEPIGLTSPYLAVTFERIEDGTLFKSDPLGEYAIIGPAGQRIRDAFVKHTEPDEKARKALWHNDTTRTQTIRATTDSYIHAKPSPKLKRLANRYWEQRGRLLLSVTPRLNTARVNTIRLDEPAVGSLWVPARFTIEQEREKIEMEKAMCAYLNSSLGWTALIGVASPKNLARPALSLDAFRRIPVPTLLPAARKKLAAAFDSLANSTFSLLQTASTDQNRAALDDALADALGIDQETMVTIRHELAREPFVG